MTDLLNGNPIGKSMARAVGVEWNAYEGGSDSLRSDGATDTDLGRKRTPLPFAGFLDSLPAACDVLRPCQRQGLAEIAQALHAGERRILRQLPTGGGKSHEIAALTLSASQAGLRVLILATRTRLVRQIHERLESFSVDHGVLAAALPEMRNLMLPIQVAIERASGSGAPGPAAG